MKTSLPQVARVAGIADESARVRTLALDLSLDAEPGQFVMTWLPGLDEKPFSLVHDRPLVLAVARVGPFSTAMHSLQPGDRLWIRGPLGRPFRLPPIGLADRGARILLAAGGYGVAPMHFLAERALAAGWKVDVVVGARTAGDVIFAERFEVLGARVWVTTDDGTRGRQGSAGDAVHDLLDRGGYRALYACGPEPMLAALERLAETFDLPAQLSYEQYMRCGLGVCGSCSRDGWLVCRDGPVKGFVHE